MPNPNEMKTNIEYVQHFLHAFMISVDIWWQLLIQQPYLQHDDGNENCSETLSALLWLRWHGERKEGNSPGAAGECWWLWILRLVLSPLGSFASHRPLTFRKVKNHFRDDDNGDFLPSVGKINSNTIITTVSYENRVIIHCHYTRRNVQVSLAAFLSFVMVYFLILSLNRFVAFSNGSMSFILPTQ